MVAAASVPRRLALIHSPLSASASVTFANVPLASKANYVVEPVVCVGVNIQGGMDLAGVVLWGLVNNLM